MVVAVECDLLCVPRDVIGFAFQCVVVVLQRASEQPKILHHDTAHVPEQHNERQLIVMHVSLLTWFPEG
jgi:hypothetical protein